MAGKEVGKMNLSDVVFGRGSKRACPSCSSKSISLQSETGHTVHPHPHRGFGRRPASRGRQKGYGPRKTGLDPRSAVDARRRGSRSEAAPVQDVKLNKKVKRVAMCSALSDKGCRPARWSSWTRSLTAEFKTTRNGRQMLSRRSVPARRALVVLADEVTQRSSRALPTSRASRQRPAQHGERLRHSQRRLLRRRLQDAATKLEEVFA